MCESDMNTNKSPFSEIVKQRIKNEKLSFLLFEAADINNAQSRSIKNPFCENPVLGLVEVWLLAD